MTATTRARFLRGLFALGADMAGCAAGLHPVVPCPAGHCTPGAEGAGNTSVPSTTGTASTMGLFGSAPLCGPGGDFTPELLRLEAERLDLPADANAEDLLHHLHQAMLDMAPPGARDSEVSLTATPDSGNAGTTNPDTAAHARQTPDDIR